MHNFDSKFYNLFKSKKKIDQYGSNRISSNIVHSFTIKIEIEIWKYLPMWPHLDLVLATIVLNPYFFVQNRLIHFCFLRKRRQNSRIILLWIDWIQTDFPRMKEFPLYILDPVCCKKQQKKFLTSYWFVK